MANVRKWLRVAALFFATALGSAIVADIWSYVKQWAVHADWSSLGRLMRDDPGMQSLVLTALMFSVALRVYFKVLRGAPVAPEAVFEIAISAITVGQLSIQGFYLVAGYGDLIVDQYRRDPWGHGVTLVAASFFLFLGIVRAIARPIDEAIVRGTREIDQAVREHVVALDRLREAAEESSVASRRQTAALTSAIKPAQHPQPPEN